MFFMIWSARRDEDKGLVWASAPLGVYEAEMAEDACKAAAADHGSVGMFFAMEGYPWGVSLMRVEGARKLGGNPRQEAEIRLRELERRALDSGLTPEESYQGGAPD